MYSNIHVMVGKNPNADFFKTQIEANLRKELIFWRIKSAQSRVT